MTGVVWGIPGRGTMFEEPWTCVMQLCSGTHMVRVHSVWVLRAGGRHSLR